VRFSRDIGAPGPAIGAGRPWTRLGRVTVLLGGGGDADDERPVLDRFAALAAQGAVAYWPVALDLDDYTAATEFVETVLGRGVQTWDHLDEHEPEEVTVQAGVFIGGGNTFHLLNEIRCSGMDGVLRSFARTGVLYGGSAGAIVIGADVDSASHIDTDRVGMADRRGLDLIGGYAVWCHFADGHRDAVTAWAQERGRPVLALTERSGVEVSNGVVSSIGWEPVLAVDIGGRCRHVGPGDAFSLGS